MKKICFICAIVLLVLMCGNFACEKNEQHYSIVDTLNGEWSWVETYTPKHGIIDNEFKSVLKVFAQNDDSSINYEVFVKDTLYHKGNFQIQYGQSYKANIKLPHWVPSLLVNENWIIYFGDILTETPSEDILCFFVGDDDGYIYYYKKIKERE